MTEHRSQPEVRSALDAGPRSRGLERFCAATRTVRPVDDMIRFVVGPDSEVVPDLKRRLPGRGVWVSASRDALADAVRRKVFARGFKRDVRTPSDLVARTEKLLERSVLDALAIANKAGLVVAGFAKVENALLHGEATALFHAADASPDGLRKLKGIAGRRPGRDSITIVAAFTSAQLDLALGRPNVVHAALLAGPATEAFLARFRRLERFRSGDTDPANTSSVAH